jgi:sporulation protein YlmC with PRC-barrel domain
MDIPINAEVNCTDGPCGRSTYLVLNPRTEKVSHLVVRQAQLPHTQIMVPVKAVVETSPEAIELSYTRDELAELQPLFQVDYVEVDIPHYTNDPYARMEPFAYPEPETVRVKHKSIPWDEMALHRGAHVEATDGRIGRVDEFIVDPDNDFITHLVLREGHLWGQKEVSVPVSEIRRIEENTVYLKLDRRSIEALPAVFTRRKGHEH